MDNDVFVKLNFKNIGELRSLIVDRKDIGSYYKGKYIMCAGKHDKNGWTIVFKARNINEAEEIVSRNSRRKKRAVASSIIENETVSIPAWMYN